jgi:hypothetical protein
MITKTAASTARENIPMLSCVEKKIIQEPEEDKAKSQVDLTEVAKMVEASKIVGRRDET